MSAAQSPMSHCRKYYVVPTELQSSTTISWPIEQARIKTASSKITTVFYFTLGIALLTDALLSCSFNIDDILQKQSHMKSLAFRFWIELSSLPFLAF
jgi:hypothetical protein